MAAMAMGLFACKPAEKVSLTIVQYNVGAFSKYEDSGIDAIVTAVKEMGADAVTFNEVDSCTTRTGVVDQLAVYAQGMGEWKQHYAAAMHGYNG